MLFRSPPINNNNNFSPSPILHTRKGMNLDRSKIMLTDTSRNTKTWKVHMHNNLLHTAPLPLTVHIHQHRQRLHDKLLSEIGNPRPKEIARRWNQRGIIRDTTRAAESAKIDRRTKTNQPSTRTKTMM